MNRILIGRIAFALISVLLPLRATCGEPKFQVYAADRVEPIVGELSEIKKDWTIRLKDASVKGEDFISMRRVDRAIPSLPRDAMLILVNGDRIRGTPVGGDKTSIDFEPSIRAGVVNQKLTLPLTSIAALWLTSPPADTPINPFDYVWATAPKRRDAVLLSNGDVLRGTVEGCSIDAIDFRKVDSKESATLPYAKMTALSFDPELVAMRKPKSAYARLIAQDGTRISLSSIECDGKTLHGATMFGAEFSCQASELAAIDLFLGKAAYLSDLKAKRSTVEPYNGTSWPFKLDRSVKDHVLCLCSPLGEETFDKGIGMHPRTSITYDLAGKYRCVGCVWWLCAASGKRGSVEIRIEKDGKSVETAVLTAGKAKFIELDMVGAKELILTTDFSRSGDIQADVDWGSARLIR